MCAYGRWSSSFGSAVGSSVTGTVCGESSVWMHDAVEEGRFAGCGDSCGSVTAAGSERHCDLCKG